MPDTQSIGLPGSGGKTSCHRFSPADSTHAVASSKAPSTLCARMNGGCWSAPWVETQKAHLRADLVQTAQDAGNPGVADAAVHVHAEDVVPRNWPAGRDLTRFRFTVRSADCSRMSISAPGRFLGRCSWNHFRACAQLCGWVPRPPWVTSSKDTPAGATRTKLTGTTTSYGIRSSTPLEMGSSVAGLPPPRWGLQCAAWPPVQHRIATWSGNPPPPRHREPGAWRTR